MPFPIEERYHEAARDFGRGFERRPEQRLRRGRHAVASLSGAWIVVVAVALGGHAAAAGDPVAGKKHYVSICAACHGLQGIASLRSAPNFAYGEHLEKDDATLIRSVRDGVFFMPPWGGFLSESEIADAIAYARTLRKNTSSAPRK